MAKGILIKAPDLFTDDEQLDIQEQFKSDDYWGLLSLRGIRFKLRSILLLRCWLIMTF